MRLGRHGDVLVRAPANQPFGQLCGDRGGTRREPLPLHGCVQAVFVAAAVFCLCPCCCCCCWFGCCGLVAFLVPSLQTGKRRLRFKQAEYVYQPLSPSPPFRTKFRVIGGANTSLMVPEGPERTVCHTLSVSIGYSNLHRRAQSLSWTAVPCCVVLCCWWDDILRPRRFYGSAHSRRQRLPPNTRRRLHSFEEGRCCGSCCLIFGPLCSHSFPARCAGMDLWYGTGYRPILDAAKSLAVDGGRPAGCCRGGGGGDGGGGCPCFDSKASAIPESL